MSTPEALLACRSGLVVAPAGCGKTHLLVDTVRHVTDGRLLVLTHTRAGVAVIRNRLAQIPPSQYRVATLDNWSSWLATRFPKASGYEPTGTPRDYDLAKQAALRILEQDFIGSLLAATYCRVLVDEYQDCGPLQHAVVQAMARHLATIAFGDPMQAIFDFNGKLPAWSDVEACFEENWTLDTPHRWNLVHETAFGAWVLEARRILQAGGTIDMRSFPSHVTWKPLSANAPVHVVEQLAAIPPPTPNTTVLVISGKSAQFKARRPELARRAVRLAMVETADLPELRAAVRTIGGRSGTGLVRAVLEFAQSVMTGIDIEGTMKRLSSIQTGTARRPATSEESALLKLVDQSDYLSATLTELQRGRSIFRPDLYDSMMKAARRSPLEEGINAVHAQRALEGRRVEPRALGSTLLLKGLEADHAVVLDADHMGSKDLYVAISRARKHLTVVSQSPILPMR